MTPPQNETPDTIRAGDAVMVWDRQWEVWREGFVRRMIRPGLADVRFIPLYSHSLVSILELTSELRLVKKPNAQPNTTP